MSPRSLFLTFGPVQEYISQARRTRDLWAGSYLLSFLAAHALHASEASEGRVVIPALKDNPLYVGVKTGASPQPPGDRVGSIPHISEIEVPDGKEPREVAAAAIQAWHKAWLQVAEATKHYAQTTFPGWATATSALWDSQVKPTEMWTATWVTAAEHMSRRKTLRNFDLADVLGEKCTVCGARQALHAGDESLRAVRSFWGEIAGKLGAIEIRPEGKERLCAPCTIRRLYPMDEVSERALGWKVQPGYPSTATMATLRWRTCVLERGQKSQELRQAVARYVQILQEAGIMPAMRDDRFPHLQSTAQAWGSERNAALNFLRYDGDWVSAETIRAEARDAQQRNRLLGAFSPLAKASASEAIRSQSTSYALLAMDGDNMGRLLRMAKDQGMEEHASAALNSFSRQAAALVEGPKARGALIYAGGDDVLALLPSDTAIATAETLRNAYHAAFKHAFKDRLATVFPEDGLQPTISAGLVFAHFHTPLQQVVKAAHEVLEREAKDGAGRNALGVRVWKRGGVALTFACKWNDAWQDMRNVADNIRNGTYSSSFVYRLRDLLPSIAGMATGGPSGSTVEDALIMAEYLKSQRRSISAAEATQAIAPLQRLVRQPSGETNPDPFAPVMLAAFLAEEA